MDHKKIIVFFVYLIMFLTAISFRRSQGLFYFDTDKVPFNEILVQSYNTTTTSNSTTTTTANSTSTTTANSTTTTTTVPANPFPVWCSDCSVGINCTCGLNTTCDDGLWLLQNKDGKPLSFPVTADIPPVQVNYTPNATGNISLLVICYSPEPSRTNRTTIAVSWEFLRCPIQCEIMKQCNCNVSGCANGKFEAVLGSMLLRRENITTISYTANFTPGVGGIIQTEADCYQPSKVAQANISVIGMTSTTTSTTISTSTSTSTTANSTTTVKGKENCRFQCCKDEPDYLDKPCPPDQDCVNNLCECANGKCGSEGNDYTWVAIPVLGIAIVLILIFFLFKKRPRTSFESLYKKWKR